DIAVPAGRAARDKRPELPGLRRKADPSQVDAPDQGPLADRRQRSQAVLFVLGRNESVDRVAHPAAVLHRGNRRAPRKLEGPVTVPGKPRQDLVCASGENERLVVRSWRVDPVYNGADLVARQLLALVGHPWLP